MRNILFIHQNMPGQFPHLARALAADPANKVTFLTRPCPTRLPGVVKAEYKLRLRKGLPHPFLQSLGGGVARGEGVAYALLSLQKQHAFVPDLIYAHPGWGESLYVKDILPKTPLINYCEFFYHGLGADTFFDPAQPASMSELMKIRTKNAVNVLALDACDAGVAPTEWQRRLHPEAYRPKIKVIHDGIDTQELRPDPDAAFVLPNGMTLKRGDEVVTYVNRSLEPCRGLNTFADAAAMIAIQRPKCQFVVVGSEDGRYYGPHPPEGTTYKDLAAARLGAAKDRVHFVGRLPRAQFVSLLQVSSAHVYLTSPFVLSWSMLEAMAVGCLVVGSNTPPVTEVIADGRNGLLADFFSPEEVSERVIEALSEQKRMEPIRLAARATVLERYALEDCLARQLSLIDEVLSGSRGAGAAATRIAEFS